jgi:hypothetical protein
VSYEQIIHSDIPHHEEAFLVRCQTRRKWHETMVVTMKAWPRSVCLSVKALTQVDPTLGAPEDGLPAGAGWLARSGAKGKARLTPRITGSISWKWAENFD